MKLHTLPGTTLAAVLALGMTPTPAADADMPARGPIPFSSFDADGNGRVSQEEFNRTRTERLQQRAQSENQYRYTGNAPAFGDLDSNADGGLSREEYQAHQQRQRELHQQQYQQQYQQRQQQMYQERMNMGGPGGMGGMGQAPGGVSPGSGRR